MIFSSQNDLINYWEGGKTYKDVHSDGTEISTVSDESRTIPYVTKKYFEVKRLYDEMKGGSRWAHALAHADIKVKMGAVGPDGISPVLDARMKKYIKGGRSWAEEGVFLAAFIDDCISFWERPYMGSESTQN